MSKREAWTPEEDAALLGAWPDPNLTVADIGELLGRTEKAVWTRARLHLKPGPKAGPDPRWTAAQDAALTELWLDPQLTAKMIGERMGVTRNSVISRARKLSLRSKVGGRIPKDDPVYTPLTWTPEREHELRRMFDEGCSFAQIAAALGGRARGVTRSAVQGKCLRLGLRREVETKNLNIRRLTPKTVPTLKLAQDVDMPPSSVWSPLPGVEPVALPNARSSHCRWPIELVGMSQPHVCGAQITLGSWCADHSAIGRPSTATRDRVHERAVRDARKAA